MSLSLSPKAVARSLLLLLASFAAVLFPAAEGALSAMPVFAAAGEMPVLPVLPVSGFPQSVAQLYELNNKNATAVNIEVKQYNLFFIINSKIT